MLRQTLFLQQLQLMTITDEMMDNLSKLARLQFTNEEKQELKADLEKMIEFMDRLKNIDTTGVQPALHITDVVNVLREDEIKEQITASEGLLNAPLKEGRFFKVPKVIKKEKQP